MKNKEELVKEYLTTIAHRLSADYDLSLDDAVKAVESLDLFNIYEGDYHFLLHEDISTWVNIAYDNYRLKFNRPLFLTPTLKQAIKDIEKHTEINNNYLKEEKKVLKEFRPDRMDVQTYNKVFLPQWTNASLFIRNLQPTLEGKCDKESLRQLQIIGWNEETKKLISDVLNLYKEKVLNELSSISNKDYNTLNKDYFDKKVEEASNNNLLENKNTDSKEKANKTADKLNELMASQLRLPKSFLEKSDKCCKTIERVNNIMENYIVINGKKAELTEEQLSYLCMFKRFAQMAKEQFGLTITQKETAGETFKTLFGVDFSDCSKRNNPFNSELEDEDSYFLIDDDGVNTGCYNPIIDKHRLDNVNSFNDRGFAKQVYLHELLNRKLLKYAYDHEAEDCEWDKEGVNPHYYIYFDSTKGHFVVGDHHFCHSQNIYFSSEEVAEQAVEDVVKPFMLQHPEFVW